jgi:hypothetical protein
MRFSGLVELVGRAKSISVVKLQQNAHRQKERISRFTQVGHHILPPLPLYLLCTGERPAALTELPLGTAQVLGSFEMRGERCSVVRYAFDRGAVRARRLGFKAGQISGPWGRMSAARFGYRGDPM